MLAPNLSTLITYNPCTVLPDTLLDEIVRTLDQMGFHHLPVADDDKRLLGMISEGDVVRAVEMLHSIQLAVDSPAAKGSSKALCASDIMSARCITAHENLTPAAVLEKLLANRIHSVPVVDGERLTGVTTSSDFLREFSYGGLATTRLSVADAMIRADEPIEMGASLDEAKLALDLACANYLAVVREGFPLGVISRREVHKARYRNTARELLGDVVSPGPTTVREIVSGAPNISPGRKLSDAAGIMIECRVQAVAVVNQANRLLGIITEDIILSALADVLRSQMNEGRFAKI